MYFIDFRHGFYRTCKIMKVGYFREEDDSRKYYGYFFNWVLHYKSKGRKSFSWVKSNKVIMPTIYTIIHKGHLGLTPESAATQSMRCFSGHDVALGPWHEACFMNTHTAGPCTVIKNWSAHDYLARLLWTFSCSQLASLQMDWWGWLGENKRSCERADLL